MPSGPRLTLAITAITLMAPLHLVAACRPVSDTPANQESSNELVDAVSDEPTASDVAAVDAPLDEPVDEPSSSGANVFDHDPASAGGVLVLAAAEPDTLYRWGGNMITAFEILDSLTDPAIVTLDYDYQAVAVEAVPRLDDAGSGARLEMVAVSPGELYVHADTHEIVTATETVTDLQQLSVRFTFRDGLTWEDGTPVTASDSMFARQLACHADTPTSKDLCDKTAHYVAVDDRTVEWRGLPGYLDQTYYSNVYRPLPKHQVGAGGSPMEETLPGDILEDEVFTRRPLSYGPFKMVEWVSGDHITVERNPHYWRSDEGLPFLDSVVFKFVTNPNTVHAALKSGDVDVAQQSVDQLDALEEAELEGSLKALVSPSNTQVVVAFNTDPVDDRVPIAACPDVRRAMTLAHDRETVVDVIGQGALDVLHSFVVSDHWAAAPESLVTTYDYDPDKAGELLSDLGFVDDDGDGVREAVREITCPAVTSLEGTTDDKVIPAGTKLAMTLNLISDDPLVEEWGLLLQQHMADVGIDIALEFLPGQVLLAKGPDGSVLGRRYDLAAFAWRGSVQPAAWVYYCDGIPNDDNGWSGLNLTGWCDPEYQRLGKSAEGTIDRGEAMPAYHEAQRIYSEQLPAMPLCTWPSILALSPGVVNVRPNPSQSTLTWNIGTWGFAE